MKIEGSIPKQADANAANSFSRKITILISKRKVEVDSQHEFAIKQDRMKIISKKHNNYVEIRNFHNEHLFIHNIISHVDLLVLIDYPSTFSMLRTRINFTN